MDKPELETLSYKAPSEVKENSTLIIKPKTKELNCSVVVQGPEQPNQNAMLLVSTDGAIDVALNLMSQLKPKTSQVDGCIVTLKGWRDNNFKHLKRAFE